MRARRTAGAFLGFSLVASCILPAAEVLQGTGGSGTGGSGTGGSPVSPTTSTTSSSSSSSSSTSTSGSSTSTSGSSSSSSSTSGSSSSSSSSGAVTVVSMTGTQAILAPSGTPGERHLIHAGNTWWVFFLPSTTELSAVSASDTDTSSWTNGLTAQVPYAFGDATHFDGRTFGIDVQNAVFHLSLSSVDLNTPQTKYHAEGSIVQGSGGPQVLAITQPQDLGAGATAHVDAPAVAIAGAPSPYVLDFASFPAGDGGVVGATAFELQEADGGVVLSGVDGLDAGTGVVQTRAALPLGSGFVAIWKEDNVGLVTAGFSGSWDAGSWQTALLPGPSTVLVTRAWAACSGTQQANVVWADPSWNFYRSVVSDPSGTWTNAAAPMGLDAGPDAGPDELFLACSPEDSVYAFTVATAGTGFPANAIITSSFTGDGGSWSPWVVVVAPPSQGPRCYLAGYDRVVTPSAGAAGPQVGLLWTESDDPNFYCTGGGIAEVIDLLAAFVPVPSN